MDHAKFRLGPGKYFIGGQKLKRTEESGGMDDTARPGCIGAGRPGFRRESHAGQFFGAAIG
jgi:hypothetical protein